MKRLEYMLKHISPLVALISLFINIQLNACDLNKEVYARFIPGTIILEDTLKSQPCDSSVIKSEEVLSALTIFGATTIEKLFDDSDPAQIIDTNPAGIEIVRPSLYGVYKFDLQDSSNANALVSELDSCQDVIYIYQNGCISEFSEDPIDPQFYLQWALKNTGQTGSEGEDINATEAWNYETGSEDVIVAVVENYIQQYHEDLLGRVYGDNEVNVNNTHGTCIAGIIGAITNNDYGIAGINWNSKILSVHIPKYPNPVTDITPAICEAKDSGANIINCSFGSASDIFQEHQGFIYAYNNNIFVAAAAGNVLNQAYVDVYPAAYENVCAVSAVASSGLFANDYSNAGDFVDITAPGGDNFGTVSGILTTTSGA